MNTGSRHLKVHFLSQFRSLAGLLRGTSFVAVIQLIALLLFIVTPAQAATDCTVAPPSSGNYRVLVVGDSWAYLALPALNAEFAKTPGMENVRATMHESPECVTAIPGSTAAQWYQYRQRIVDALIAYPDVTVVHLSLGANDMALFGMADSKDPVRREWAFRVMQMSAVERAGAFGAIQTNIRGVVQQILAVRPNIRVVIASYDYFNQVDAAAEFRPDAGYVGLVPEPAATNPWLWQQISNWMLTDLERYKKDVASVDKTRVFYLPSLGLVQYMKGYKLTQGKDFNLSDFQYPSGSSPSTTDGTIPVASAPLPWSGGFPFLPTPADMMTDRLHLNQAGNQVHAWWATSWFYKPWLVPK